MKIWNKKGIWSAVAAAVIAFVPGTPELAAQNAATGGKPNDKMPRVLREPAREDYFFNLLRDPATNAIPIGIRDLELAHAEKMEKNRGFSLLDGIGFEWKQIGPTGVGGRTRALAIDPRNPNIILAGGVSGGMWKSIDGGATWALKSDPNKNLSVTTVAQDPINKDVWYFAGGESQGNSASATGGAVYLGSGVFKSTDNGETWKIMTYSPATPPTTSFTAVPNWKADATPNAAIQTSSTYSPFMMVQKIMVAPNGTIFLASSGFGIMKSTDGGATFSKVLPNVANNGTTNVFPFFADIVSDKKGVLTATMSQRGRIDRHLTAAESGIYRSTDNGATWTRTLPISFPAAHQRTVLAQSPVNDNIVYSVTYTGGAVGGADDLRLFKTDYATGISVERSANIPNYGGSVGALGQSNYDLILAVKPDDENFVMLGTTNLYRSTDGFATKPAINDGWIGGYSAANNVSQYPGHHPDNHSFAFDPTNPNIFWSGHDGGISKTTDIKATGTQNPVKWDRMNNNYIVTQFYSMSIPKEAGDKRVMGGAQDNGTPYMYWEKGQTTLSEGPDVTSGDGSYGYFGKKFLYGSTQTGRIRRIGYDADKDPSYSVAFSRVHPSAASGQLFINPFAINPANENVMYYPGGSSLWLNKAIESVPEGANGSSVGWVNLTAANAGTGYTISAMSFSETGDKLYYAAYSSTLAPKLFRIDNANNATASTVPTAINITGIPVGSYPNWFAVNPTDPNEVMVAFTNYNITGLYHSANAGATWTAVEGNLTGTTALPGPSIRSVKIVTLKGDKVYLVGTSTGLYSTATLNGNNTQWMQEGADVLGSVIITAMDTRDSDGRIAIGTHGRGAFVGEPQTPAPVATAATNQLETSFTANWLASAGATSYLLEVATDAKFKNVVPGYDDKEVTGLSASVTGLTANTEYFYSVRAKDANRVVSVYSNDISTKTNLVAPVVAALTDLKANSLKASWTTVPGATAYQFDVATDSVFTAKVAGYDNKEITGLTFEITGLMPNTKYYVRARAKDGSRISVNSKIVSAFTNLAVPVATAGTAPLETSFTANWLAPAGGGATAYLLDVATDADFKNMVAGFTAKEVVGISASVTGLKSNTEYFYKIKAKDATRVSEFSNVIARKTNLVATVAGALTNLMPTSFKASWTAVPGATSYLFDVSTNDAFTAKVAGYDSREITGLTFEVSGLMPNVKYFLRARAKDGDRVSVNSNTVSAVTELGTPVATAPTAVKPAGFTANWTSPNNSLQTFLLDVSADPKFATFVTGYQAKAVTGNSFAVTGLKGMGDYYFRVRAQDGARLSDYSNGIWAQTAQALGTEESVLNNKLTLFPNPVGETFQLATDDAALNAKTFSCQIFDTKGGLVYTKLGTLAQLNQDFGVLAGGLNAGAYTINLAVDGLKISKRFVKE